MHHYKVDHLLSSLHLYGKRHLPHWHNNAPIKGHQGTIILPQVLRTRSQSLVQVWIHYLCPTSLIYHDFFDIEAPNPQCNYQGILLRLNSILEVFPYEINAFVLLTTISMHGSFQFYVRSRIHDQHPRWCFHSLHLFPNCMYYPYEAPSWCRCSCGCSPFQVLRVCVFQYQEFCQITCLLKLAPVAPQGSTILDCMPVVSVV